MNKNLLQYLSLKEEIEKSNAKIEQLENDENFKKELEFLKDLEDLLELHGKSKVEVAEILNPTQPAAPATNTNFGKTPRKRRVQRTYKNPNTGETVTTAGGNNLVLRKWRAENPDLVLADWLVE